MTSRDHVSNVQHALVIEDDQTLRNVLDRVLLSVSPDIEIEWVASAEEALALIESEVESGKKNPYDLVIADIFLEGKTTGIDFWQKCQALAPGSSVLLMSAMPVDRFLNVIGKYSIAPPFLPKPFRTGECRQIVSALLDYSQKKRDPIAA